MSSFLAIAVLLISGYPKGAFAAAIPAPRQIAPLKGKAHDHGQAPRPASAAMGFYSLSRRMENLFHTGCFRRRAL
jgi:hypothetical protein